MYQIEFCYRDSKQFTGLTDRQSRDLNKLHFHFNASLTSVNLAKVKTLLEMLKGLSEEERMELMADLSD